MHIFHPFFAIFGPIFSLLAELPIPYSSSISGQSYTKNQKNLWTGCRKMLKNAYFSHIFRHFWPKNFFSCKTAYAIFKVVVYQASLIPKIRKIYGLVAETCMKTHIFHTFLVIFGPKKIFLQNFLCHIQSSIPGQSHTKNQKNIQSGCQEMLKNAYFHTFFAIFGHNFFFQKSGSISFLEL